jgi:hypothetical protein
MKRILAGIIFILAATSAHAQQPGGDQVFPRPLRITFSTPGTPALRNEGESLFKGIFVLDNDPILTNDQLAPSPSIELHTKYDATVGAGTSFLHDSFSIFATRPAQTGEARLYLGLTAGGNGGITIVDRGLQLPASATAPPLSQSGQARFYYDSVGGAVRLSLNGAAYSDLLSGTLPTNSVTTGNIVNGTILFADWNQNGCGVGTIPKWNGTAWACAGDDTSPGGNSWLTVGNTLGAAGTLGSIDAFDVNLIRGNVAVGSWQSDGIHTPLQFTSDRTGANSIGFNSSASTIGANFGYVQFINRTSTLPTIGVSQSAIIMDNGVLKANQAGAGWVSLLTPVVRTMAVFRPSDAEQPATNFGTFGSRNNHPILAFDAATIETVYFTGVIPEWYDNSTGIDVQVFWVAATAVTGNAIWTAAIELMDGSTDIDADSFGTVISRTQTAPGTSGVTATAIMSFTRAQADNITAGSPFRVRITRDASNAGDTMAGDAQLTSVQVRTQ